MVRQKFHNEKDLEFPTKQEYSQNFVLRAISSSVDLFCLLERNLATVKRQSPSYIFRNKRPIVIQKVHWKYYRIAIIGSFSAGFLKKRSKTQPFHTYSVVMYLDSSASNIFSRSARQIIQKIYSFINCAY